MSGRPTSYTPEHAEKARLFYETGATDEQVARLLGVHLATLYRWRERHPDFALAANVGKDDADARVTAAMYRRAIGYDHREIKAFVPLGAKEAVQVAVTRHVPANPQVGMQWLRIRRPAEWREQPVLPQNHDLAERLAEAIAYQEARELAQEAEARRLLSDGELQFTPSVDHNETY
jgi:transposase-like protein